LNNAEFPHPVADPMKLFHSFFIGAIKLGHFAIKHASLPAKNGKILC
jgi:hypothetical protein